ncbi:hypothetical protein BC834DRAFT_975136 [Gloeopeniophorella convolvens]|nr:hypothetical protein BC834DRAFT_975136 [Gloeopeniophorella convolvens]
MAAQCAGYEAHLSCCGYCKHLQLTTRGERVKIRGELGLRPFIPPSTRPLSIDLAHIPLKKTKMGAEAKSLLHSISAAAALGDLVIEGGELDADIPEPGWEPSIHLPRKLAPALVPGLGSAVDERYGFQRYGCLLAQPEVKVLRSQMFEPVRISQLSPGRAGAPVRRQELSKCKVLRKKFDATSPGNAYARSASEVNYEMARWAKQRGPSSRALADFLVTPGIPEHLGVSFKNAQELNNAQAAG